MTNEEFIKSVSLEGEIWKDVPGFEDLYLCSNYGRVVVTKSHVQGVRKMKLMILRVNNNGYNYLLFYKDNKRKHIYIHRLVGALFVPNPNNYPHIDHIDGNKNNNRYDNIRWCNRSMNMNNPITIKRMSDCRKGKHTSKAIQIVQLKNGRLINIFRCAFEAHKYGFCYSCVRACCRGVKESYKGFQWMNLSKYEALINKSKNEAKPMQSDYQQPQPPQLQDPQLPLQFEP